jgi:hypothetical protein
MKATTAGGDVTFFKRGNGSSSSNPVSASSVIGGIYSKGWDGSIYGTSSYMEFLAAEAYSSTAHGDSIRFVTHKNASISGIVPVTIGGGGANNLVVLGKTTSSLKIGDPGFAADYTGLSFGSFASNGYNVMGQGTDLFINRPTGNSIMFRENNGANQILISPGGNVSIPNHLLLSSLPAGTAMIDGVGNIYSVSDEKTKTNIVEYKPASALSKINAVKIYTYNWAKESGLSTVETNLGVISQQLKTAIPEAVSTHIDTIPILTKTKDGADSEYIDTPTGTFTEGVSDRAIISMQVLAIQELSAKSDTQQATIEAQQKEIDELRIRLDKAKL